MSDELFAKAVELIKRQIIAAAILQEAGRLAGGNQRILPGALANATEDFQRVLTEMQKKGW